MEIPKVPENKATISVEGLKEVQEAIEAVNAALSKIVFKVKWDQADE